MHKIKKILLSCKSYLLFKKFKSYLKKRVLPIALLWFSVAFSYWTLTDVVGTFLVPNQQSKIELIPLENLADGKVVSVLIIGIAVLTLVFLIVSLNVNNDATDREGVMRLLYSTLDEVSSAATHIGMTLVAAYLYQWVTAGLQLYGVMNKIMTVLAYLLIGWVLFWHEDAASVSVESTT